MQQLKFITAAAQLLDTTAAPVLIGLAYSGGNAGHNPEGINNAVYQSVHDVGPIPPGKYAGKRADLPHKGIPNWTLTPDPSNVMYGRSEFMIHWDTATQNFAASDGCIVPVTSATFSRIQAEFELTVI